jgi:hypothetical protein
LSATKTVERMEQRVRQLIAEFSPCLEAFDVAQLFTGPSLHFYFKTLGARAKHGNAIEALNDDEFFEGLYATLTAWGMHRMGPGNAKLADLAVIKASFQRQREPISRLEAHDITSMEQTQLHQLTNDLWNVLRELRVGIGQTKIVANSKALHLLLPALMPPIDREYTIRFFYSHTTLSRGDEDTFREIYPYFHQIASSCRDAIRQRVKAGQGMDTCATKVIDNAIVGFVRTHFPRKSATAPSGDGLGSVDV